MMAVLELYLISVVKIMAPRFFKTTIIKTKLKDIYCHAHENKLLSEHIN